MLYLLMAVVILVWLIIYPVTDYYLRYRSHEVLRRSATEGGYLFLTFDDGPDPQYTPLVLKILAQQKVPAVFFLVAAKARENPEIVKQILEAGHGVGLHSLEHRHAYLCFWKSSRAAIVQGKQVLEEITGSELRYYRSPWGATNLFQYYFLKKSGLKLMLWSADAEDWRVRTGVHGVLANLIHKVRSGAILDLHDSGGEPGAPAILVEALPKIITSFREEGYQFADFNAIQGGLNNIGRQSTQTTRYGN